MRQWNKRLYWHKSVKTSQIAGNQSGIEKYITGTSLTDRKQNERISQRKKVTDIIRKIILKSDYGVDAARSTYNRYNSKIISLDYEKKVKDRER